MAAPPPLARSRIPPATQAIEITEESVEETVTVEVENKRGSKITVCDQSLAPPPPGSCFLFPCDLHDETRVLFTNGIETGRSNIQCNVKNRICFEAISLTLITA